MKYLRTEQIRITNKDCMAMCCCMHMAYCCCCCKMNSYESRTPGILSADIELRR